METNSWDLDLLQEAFISVPDSCADDTFMNKLQDLHDAAALHHPGATPPPCHASPTHQHMLPPEDNLTSWDPSLLSQVSSDAARQALPSLLPLSPHGDVHEPHLSHAAQPHTLSWGLYGSQGLPQATQGLPKGSQGLSQASQSLSQGPPAPWSLQPLSQALQDASSVRQTTLELRHEVPRDSPMPAVGEAGVSVACRSPASPDRPGASRRGRRVSQSPREKLYQRKERFEDPVQEKKRIDAINSKKNRDRRAAELNQLRLKVDRYTQQRDKLLQDVHDLQQREADLLRQLNQTPAASPAYHHPPTPPPPASTPVQPQLPFAPLTPPSLHPVTASPPPYHAHHITLIPPRMPCQDAAHPSTRPGHH